LRDLQRQFIKESVRQDANYSVGNIDVFDKEKVVNAKDVDIGYSTRNALKHCDDVSKKEILVFKNDCLMFLQTSCQKLQTKSPLKYSLTKSITFCDPTVVSSSTKTAVHRLKATLEALVGNAWLSGSEAERSEVEFCSIISQKTFLEKCKLFKKPERMLEERLDTFWVSACSLYGSGEGGVLMKVLRPILTLSHGNAPCERGFSLNKECLIENQKHETLVALRQV